MGTRTAVTGGGKLLTRTPVSLTNTLAATANGSQDYIHNALTQSRENTKGAIVAPSGAQRICNTQAHRSKTRSRQLRLGPPTLVAVQASRYDSLLITDWALGSNESHSILTHRKLFIKHT